MPILGERFYQISNAIFCYDLKPIPLAVYSYLVCCAGQKELCWPSIKTIALQLFGKRCEGRSQAISGSRIHPQGGNQQADAPRRKLAAEQQPLLHPASACASRHRPLHRQGLRRRRWRGSVSTKRRVTRKSPRVPFAGLCGGFGTMPGPKPPGIPDGFGLLLRLCGERKKKQDKGVTSSPPIFGRHICPQRGQFQEVPKSQGMGSKTEGNRNSAVLISQRLRPQEKIGVTLAVSRFSLPF